MVQIIVVLFLFRNYLGTIDEYCLKYWSKEDLLTDFLQPQRIAYETAIKGKLFRKGSITNLTNDGTLASVIDVVSFLHGDNYIVIQTKPACFLPVAICD